jgi:glycosyltransferase involved in cell wall biosynthesis
MPATKILYIINHMDWFWSHRLPLANGAKGRGWLVTIAAPGAQTDTGLGQYGFSGRGLPDGGFMPWTLLKTIWRIHRLIRAEKPDLIHAITLKCALTAGLAACFYPRLPVVYTVAGLGYLFSPEGLKPKLARLIAGPFLKLALKRKRTQIIFQNPDDRALMIRNGFVDPARCHLIRGSGVDTEKFSFSPEPENAQPVVVMATRLVRDKGISVFVEAARILKNDGVNALFHVAGSLSKTNPQALTQAEMDMVTADGTVQWLGNVEDMAGLFSTANLVVYPSWYGEGIPKVLLEAAACGRAIVTTDHPGCREAVHHGENGLLVPVKNPQETAAAIGRLLQDRTERLRMGRNGRRRAETEFDVRLIVRETLGIYDLAQTA